MGNSVQELLEMLYTMVSEAWGLPLGAEKCVIERDKVLDIIDEIKAQFPQELAEAKRVVSTREDLISSAKREADSMRKAAEERAKYMINDQEIVKSAKLKSGEILASAEKRAAELRRVANEYAEDTLRRTEEAISEALEEVKQSRSRFRSVAGTIQRQAPAASDFDIDIEE